MELRKQVCSVDLSQKLRELGVPQVSLYSHWATDIEEDGLTWWTVSDKEPRRGKRVRECSTPGHYRGRLSAFTVAELGEKLPGRIKRDDGVWLHPDFHKDSTTHHWYCYYQGGENVEYHTIADTEADARAKMLILLLENKLTVLENA